MVGKSFEQCSSCHRWTTIQDDEVYVWYVYLNQSAPKINRMARLLSKEEWQRTNQLRGSELQNQYILCHGVLRMIVSEYTDTDPTNIAFEHGEFGKPKISGFRGKDGIEFNLAHTRGLGVYAFNLDARVGIDIEHLSIFPEMEAVASQIFDPETKRFWQSLPEEKKMVAFYNGWTRKEAYLKAMGTGLKNGLKKVEVTIVPEEPARLRGFNESPDRPIFWSLESFNVHSEYIGAIAYEGHSKKVRIREWII
jgi:4'-phosphopantetheinyl transferase